MKQLVISGINLFQGGALSVYYDCLDSLIKRKIYEKYEITIFVHKKNLFEKYKNFINVIDIDYTMNIFIFIIIPKIKILIFGYHYMI